MTAAIDSLRRGLTRWVVGTRGDDLEESDFRRYADATTTGFVRLVCVVGSVLLVGLWPLDLLIYDPGDARLVVSGRWRLQSAGLLVAAVAVGAALERRRWPTLPVWVATYLAFTALSFEVVSGLGDPTTPWVHTAMLVPLLSVSLLVGLRLRALVTVAGAAAALGAYFGPRPSHLGAPYVASLFGSVAAACVMSIVLGHAFYLLTRRGFDLRLELRRLGRVDALTGVWNRGYLLERAAHEVLRARRTGEPLAVIVLDLDRFKAVNDTWGHATGDAVLRDFVARAAQVLRRTDLVGRMGGEEFVVLLPDTSVLAAADAAERLRAALAAASADGGELPAYTVSAGCAALAEEDRDADGLLRRADAALYAAKEAGRNRVVVAPDPPAAARSTTAREAPVV